MSKKTKNVVRKAYMSNFSKKKKHRYIITEKNTELDRYLQQNSNRINDRINYAIQELSIKITDRQLPFMTIEKIPIGFDSAVISQEDKKRRVRGVIRDITTDEVLLESIGKRISENENISHSIEFFANTTYDGLTFSNNHFDVKVLTEKEVLEDVFADIFLDSAMFNSYSFLKEMSNEEKHEFGKKKFEFYIKHNLPCYYRLDIEDENRIFYYSLAFSCRTSNNDFDYDKYIELWNDFIKDYYSDKVHLEKSITEQLNQYIDPKQLPKSLSRNLARREEGAYLVLRINRNQTISLNERIMNYFGLKEYHIGVIKVVPILEYYRIQDMLKNLDVAAYKVVKISRKKKNES